MSDLHASVWWMSNSSSPGTVYPWAVMDLFDDPHAMPVRSDEISGPGAVEKGIRTAFDLGCDVVTVHLWGPDHGLPSPNDKEPR